MDAQDNLKIIHTVDGTSLQNRYGKSVIQSHDIGLISLPTGEIVMADPTLRFEIADFKRKAFQQKVRPGMYPVFAYTAHSDRDCVLAFAEICFTDRPPVTFKAAKTLWDTERSRRRNCGYVVSESTTGFMDGQYFKDACMKSEFSDLEHEMVLDEILKENQERWGIRCAAGISPDGSYSAALFTVPSGVYYWYWGKDQNGEICCLVAFLHTFELLQHRINKKEYIQEEAAAVKRRGISFSEIKSYKLYGRWKP